MVFAVAGLAYSTGLWFEVWTLYEHIAGDYYIPVLFPNGLPTVSSDWLIINPIAGAIIVAAIFGWRLGGSRREAWRFHLFVIQWLSLGYGVIAGWRFAQSIPPFIEFFCAPQRGCLTWDLIGIGETVAPTAFGTSMAAAVFLAAFWWGREIDSAVIRESWQPDDPKQRRRRRALIDAIGHGSPHPGHAIVLLGCYPMLVIGVIWAVVHFREQIRAWPMG